MQEKPIVVITVPHARCIPIEVERTCDRAALLFAQQLQDYLEFTDKVEPELFIPEPWEYRSICDLNRIQCRFMPYRQELTEFLSEHHEQIPFLVDIHSFPDEYTDFGDVDVAILENDVQRDGHEPYAILLLDYLREAGIPASLLYGTSITTPVRKLDEPLETNDIIDQAQIEFDIPSILVEINEKFALEENQIDKLQYIVEVVGMWLEKVVERLLEANDFRTEHF